MCVGVPMRILEAFDGWAMATGAQGTGRINTLLVGAVAPGDHVLVHIDNAVRAITPEEAALVADALEAVARASRGEDFDHLIADLAGREPELPAHLRA
jgi:hydrogenase expression/formation protein HypC